MANYKDDAQREHDQSKIFRDWIQTRIETVHQRVSASDVLSRYGVKLRYSGGRAEQMFCPFHGNKRTPAARYHPRDTRKPDHVWCFVCNEQWDCINLYKKFENLTSEKFSQVLRGLERAYGITPPETPSVHEDEPDDLERADVDMAFAVAEARLKGARKAFDMNAYLTVGSILDRLRWQFENGKVLAPTVRQTLQRVLDKIGAKARACPED
jgi:hypothetical protein